MSRSHRCPRRSLRSSAILGLLFHRVGRGLAISAAGHALVGPARQTLRELATARASVARVIDVATGSLDVATVPTLAVDPLAKLVGEYRLRFPGVALRLHERETTAAVKLCVQDGECELALAPTPLKDASLVVHSLGEQELMVVAPPSLPLASQRFLTVSDLHGVPMVASPSGTSTRSLLEAALAETGAAPHIAVEVSSREAIVPLVLNGAGATLLPKPLAEEAARRGALLYSVKPAITRGVGLLHRRGPLSPAASALVELAGVTSSDR